jgi:hypothetical protein
MLRMIFARCCHLGALAPAGLFLLFAPLACKAPTEGQLDKPVYAWNHESDFCGSTVVIDG